MRMLLIKIATDLGFHVKQRKGMLLVGTRADAQLWFPVRNLAELMEVVV